MLKPESQLYFLLDKFNLNASCISTKNLFLNFKKLKRFSNRWNLVFGILPNHGYQAKIKVYLRKKFNFCTIFLTSDSNFSVNLTFLIDLIFYEIQLLILLNNSFSWERLQTHFITKYLKYLKSRSYLIFH